METLRKGLFGAFAIAASFFIGINPILAEETDYEDTIIYMDQAAAPSQKETNTATIEEKEEEKAAVVEEQTPSQNSNEVKEAEAAVTSQKSEEKESSAPTRAPSEAKADAANTVTLTIKYQDVHGATIDETVTVEVEKNVRVTLDDYKKDLSANKYVYVQKTLNGTVSTLSGKSFAEDAELVFIYQLVQNNQTTTNTYVEGRDGVFYTRVTTNSTSGSIGYLYSGVETAGVSKVARATITLDGTTYEAIEAEDDNGPFDFGTYENPKFYFTLPTEGYIEGILIYNPAFINEYESKVVDFYYVYTDTDVDYKININYYFLDGDSIFQDSMYHYVNYNIENEINEPLVNYMDKLSDQMYENNETSNAEHGIRHFVRETQNHKAGELIDYAYPYNSKGANYGGHYWTHLEIVGGDGQFILPIQEVLGIDITTSELNVDENGQSRGFKVYGNMIHSDISIHVFLVQEQEVVVQHVLLKDGVETELAPEEVYGLTFDSPVHPSNNRPYEAVRYLRDVPEGVECIGYKTKYENYAYTGNSTEFGALKTPVQDMAGWVDYPYPYMRYYYKFIYIQNGKVNVHHVDKEGNYIRVDREGEDVVFTQTATGEVGTSYADIDINKPIEIAGYVNTATDTNDFSDEKIYRDTPVDIFYIYEPIGQITVKHIDKETQTEFTEYREEKSGVVGDNYSVSSVNIEHYTLETNPDHASGEYTYESYGNPVEIIFEYVKNTGKVIVHHKDKDTDTDITTVEESGKVGTTYTAAPTTIENYHLDETTLPEEPTVTFTEETQELTYYYIKNTGSLTVKYVDADNNDAEFEGSKEESEGKIGTPYETVEKTFENYTLSEVEGAGTGEYGVEPITVIYKYTKNTGTVIVKYIDLDNNNAEFAESREELTGKIDSPYETVEKTFENYTLSGVEGATTGEYGVEPITVIYKYTKNNGKVIVKYVDIDNEEAEFENSKETLEGKIGTLYETVEKSFENYSLVSVEGQTVGLFDSTELTVTYKYSKNDGKVIVHHVDQDTQEDIESEEHTGKIGTTYTTSSKEYEVYELVGSPENPVVTFDEQTQEISYYYAKPKGKVEIHYIDIMTGEDIEGYYEESEGYVDETYETVEKQIDGYRFVRLTGTTEGNYPYKSTEVVSYFYQRIGKVVAHYYEVDTENSLVPDFEDEGPINTYYVTEEEEIEGYSLVETPENANDKFQEELSEVFYYYQKLGKVITHYLDSKGNELIAATTQTGVVGSDYQTTPAEIDDYELTGIPSNAEGNFAQEDTHVNYIYSIPVEPETEYGTVHVKHMMVTGSVLEEDEITDEVDTPYETQAIDNEDLELVSVIGTAKGTIPAGDSYVIYMYKQKEEPTPEPEPVKYGTVIAHYVDENGNAIASDVILTQKVGTTYITSQKVIPGYTGSSIPSNRIGTVEEGILELEYTYTKDEEEEEEQQCNNCCCNNCNCEQQAPQINITIENNPTIEINPTIENNVENNTEVDASSTNENNIQTGDTTVENNTNVETGDTTVENNTSVETGDNNITTGDTTVTTGDVNIENNPVNNNEVNNDTNVENNPTNNVEVNPTIENNSSSESNNTNTNTSESNPTIDLDNSSSSESNPTVEIENNPTNTNSNEANPTNTNSNEANPTNTNNNETNASNNNESTNTNENNPVNNNDGNNTNTNNNENNNNVNTCQTGCGETEPTPEPQPEQPKRGKVIVRYVDEEGYSVSPTITIDGEVDENYVTDQLRINGYEIDRVEGATEDSIKEDPTYVTYYYKVAEEPKQGKVLVHYIDTEGKSLADDEVINGSVGDQYVATEKVINGYTLLDVVKVNKAPVRKMLRALPAGKPNIGTITEELIELNFIYEADEVPVSGKVIVQYLDNKNYTIAPKVEIEGNVDEDYLTEQLKINGYDIDRVEGEVKGNISEGTTYVTYYYNEVEEEPTEQPTCNENCGTTVIVNCNNCENEPEPQPEPTPEPQPEPEQPAKGQVIANYVDINGKKISGRIIYIGYVGNDYGTTEKTIDGYYLVRVDGETTGQFIDGTIEVYYVYESTEGTGDTDIEPEPEEPTKVDGETKKVQPPKTSVDKIIALRNIICLILISILSVMITRKKMEN